MAAKEVKMGRGKGRGEKGAGKERNGRGSCRGGRERRRLSEGRKGAFPHRILTMTSFSRLSPDNSEVAADITTCTSTVSMTGRRKYCTTYLEGNTV
jgi:hypothetical protein